MQPVLFLNSEQIEAATGVGSSMIIGASKVASARAFSSYPVTASTDVSIGELVNLARCRSYSPNEGNSTFALRA
jgi:hypothetical protein